MPGTSQDRSRIAGRINSKVMMPRTRHTPADNAMKINRKVRILMGRLFLPERHHIIFEYDKQTSRSDIFGIMHNSSAT